MTPDRNAPCIEAKSGDKHYPRVRIEGRPTYLHRVVWEQARGPIPAGMTIDHVCFNRRCINLSHLDVVSQAENTARAQARRWAGYTCPHGNPAKRRCSRCNADRQRAYRSRLSQMR